jgi:hypothetical protein
VGVVGWRRCISRRWLRRRNQSHVARHDRRCARSDDDSAQELVHDRGRQRVRDPASRNYARRFAPFPRLSSSGFGPTTAYSAAHVPRRREHRLSACDPTHGGRSRYRRARSALRGSAGHSPRGTAQVRGAAFRRTGAIPFGRQAATRSRRRPRRLSSSARIRSPDRELSLFKSVSRRDGSGEQRLLVENCS